MARINVEDTIWRDDRFDQLKVLLGNRAVAIGWLVVAWDLAHIWFGKTPTHLIPVSEWEKAKMPSALMETGFAELRDGGVYVRGTNDHCRYILDRKEAGRRGAAKTNEKLHGKTRQTRQVTPSSSPLPLLSSVEDSSLREEATALPATNVVGLPPKKGRGSPEVGEKAQKFIAAYASAYKAKHGGYPDEIRDGRVVGQINSWIAHYPLDRALQLVQAFMQIDDRWFDQRGRCFEAFRANLNKIGTALDSGQNPGSPNWEKIFGEKPVGIA